MGGRGGVLQSSSMEVRWEIRLNQIALDVGEGARKKMGEYFRQFLDAINEWPLKLLVSHISFRRPFLRDTGRKTATTNMSGMDAYNCL